MPTRNINDAVKPLQEAWIFAQAEFIRIYPSLPQPFLTCVHRSNEEQDTLYSIGRTRKGAKVTNAKAGQSKHNKLPSEAFDVAFKYQNSTVLYWEDHLFRKFYEIVKVKSCIKWGGKFVSFKDYPHFECDLRVFNKIVK